MRCIQLSFLISLLVVVSFAMAQETAPAEATARKTELSDTQYTARALSAAPKAMAKQAGVARVDKDGKMSTLRESKNGFTCTIMMGNSMCADANSMAFFGAYMKHENPPDKLGLTYMLAGDNGASNTDPHATAKTADNHWVVTGPHIMVVGPGAKSLALSEAPDPDPSKPYMMWAGTPYEHAMIPVGGSVPAKSAMAEKKEEAK
jgi:hypothetical protein